MTAFLKNNTEIKRYFAPMCRVFTVDMESYIAQASPDGMADSDDYEDNFLDDLDD